MHVVNFQQQSGIPIFFNSVQHGRPSGFSQIFTFQGVLFTCECKETKEGERVELNPNACASTGAAQDGCCGGAAKDRRYESCPQGEAGSYGREVQGLGGYVGGVPEKDGVPAVLWYGSCHPEHTRQNSYLKIEGNFLRILVSVWNQSNRRYSFFE